MKVLVGCEFSGIVRDAFIARGHDAVSCDLLPSERPGPHIQADINDDIMEIWGESWNLGIFHPPCRYLASSGARWFKERKHEQDKAVRFFMRLWGAPIERIAEENPIGVMSTRFRKPDQIIQPWQFGHNETKATCLWLRNLPPLVPTSSRARWSTPPVGRVWRETPSPNRWKNRSRTYQGIADAMAQQWGDLT